MKRSKPLRRQPPGRAPAARKARDEATRRLEVDERRARNMEALVAAAPASAKGVIERVIGFSPAPKSPADRNGRARELAEGEECLIRYLPVCQWPRTDTTVLCHSNTQAHEKGMGYKAHDSEGVFGCAACHDVIDGRDYLHRLDGAEIEFLMGRARRSMAIRLRQIINTPSERPWRKRAAQWVLDQHAARARRGENGDSPC